MSERFTRLYTLENSLYQEGSPVIIAAGALLKDSISGAAIAQLKFKSISKKPIKAVKIFVQSLSTTGEILGEEIEHQYLDLNIIRDDEFGQREAIRLPDNTTRAFIVGVTEVAFADNSTWKSNGKVFEAIVSPKTLDTVFNDDQELIKQYKLDYGTGALVFPVTHKDLWFCNCGAINHADEENCHICRASANHLFSCDIENLNKKRNIRIKDEVYEKAIALIKTDTIESLNEARAILVKLSGWKDSEEKITYVDNRISELSELAQIAAENARIQKSKKRKRNIILAISCMAIAILAFVLHTVIIPGRNYNAAIERMNEGNYSEAEEMLAKLGDYKDSQEILTECKYLDAVAKTNAGEYESAMWIFADLKDYKDSADYTYYSQALYCLDNNRLEDAYGSLLMIPGFKDADDIFSSLIALPETIKYDSSYDFTFTFSYNSNGVMTKAVADYNSNKQTYTCDDNGYFTTMTDTSKLYPPRRWTFTYNSDGTVTMVSDRMTYIYDKYGMEETWYSSDNRSTYTHNYNYDSHHNPNQSSNTNHYEHGLLRIVESRAGNLVSTSTITYKVVYRTSKCDEDLVWKNVRIVAGDNLW